MKKISAKNFLIAASTDVGIKKATNQDSIMLKNFQTSKGKMVLAVICDGMGGLDKGEVASATVINAFNNWLVNDLSGIIHENEFERHLKEQWTSLVCTQNEKIINYGKRNGVTMGTTVAALLVTNDKYYIMNIGDSRVYQITEECRALTIDQTVVEDEVRRGILTREQAEKDPRRSVLLQCVGASNQVNPEFVIGDTMTNAVYMLCSDGFRHEITEQEIFEGLNPGVLISTETMKQKADELIELNKQRRETDNITVGLVRTYQED